MNRHKCALIAVALAAALAVATGCGKKAERPDDAVTEQPQNPNVDPVDLDAVDGQTLESAPCGNPDWSKLPPQSNAEPL